MRSDLNKSYYESLYEDSVDPASFEVRSKLLSLKHALRSVRIANGAPRVLDVGFGGGEILNAASKAYPKARCAGVENAQTAIQTVGRAHPDWDLRVACAGELPFESKSFDVVICSHTLEHLADDLPAAQEIRRVVKPQGYVVIGVPGPASGDNPLHERLYTPEMLQKLFGGLQTRYMRCYGSHRFLTIYWKIRKAAQSAKMIETGEIQSSRGTGSILSKIGMAAGIPILLALYEIDSRLFQDVKNPFEVWAVWQNS